ncbi:unnamed protein product [Acanthosepion pharaonis]|uniref:Uncharacterized protein n=1 Tax=Acanthosepion pharaonis TaxID=158019 RepID=A0A812BEM6_ACAPH|nr:unnamed protein product [Sepia pharaonis]
MVFFCFFLLPCLFSLFFSLLFLFSFIFYRFYSFFIFPLFLPLRCLSPSFFSHNLPVFHFLCLTLSSLFLFFLLSCFSLIILFFFSFYSISLHVDHRLYFPMECFLFLYLIRTLRLFHYFSCIHLLFFISTSAFILPHFLLYSLAFILPHFLFYFHSPSLIHSLLLSFSFASFSLSVTKSLFLS